MKKSSQLLKKYFGFDEFRPIQEEVINSVTSGNDVLLLMPTGGGKSLCYQLPALLLEGITIVISPLIALMKDQVEALKENGVAAACLNSSQDYALEALILNQCRNQEIKLLYISPEKAVSLKNTLFSDLSISLFAIDEAHYYAALAFYRNNQRDRAMARFEELVKIFPMGVHYDKAKQMLALIKKGTL